MCWAHGVRRIFGRQISGSFSGAFLSFKEHCEVICTKNLEDDGRGDRRLSAQEKGLTWNSLKDLWLLWYRPSNRTHPGTGRTASSHNKRHVRTQSWNWSNWTSQWASERDHTGITEKKSQKRRRLASDPRQRNTDQALVPGSRTASTQFIECSARYAIP